MIGRLTGKAFNLGKDLLIPQGVTLGQLAARGVPDALFAGVAAASAGPEATAADRALLAASSFGGGFGGGIVASNAAKKLMPKAGNTMLGLIDMGGSVVGDMAAMPVGLAATRVADRVGGGQGLDPYERMSAQQHAVMEQQIADRLMAMYGGLPGTYQDNFLAQNGLG